MIQYQAGDCASDYSYVSLSLSLSLSFHCSDDFISISRRLVDPTLTLTAVCMNLVIQNHHLKL